MRLPEKIFVATQPINMQLSFDRLAGIVRGEFGDDPREDAVFVFHNRRRTYLKLLWHDGTGYRILMKRLDRGQFRIPLAIPTGATKVRVSDRELRIIFEGINMKLINAARKAAMTAQV